MKDNGPNPYVVNIEEASLQNDNFRTAIWTGKYSQTTLMAIQPGDDIGLEMHDNHDQFLRLEQGTARIEMGTSKEELQTWEVGDDFAIFIPAGTWHNLTNIGNEPVKLYSIYSPGEHPHGTVHATKAEADAAEGH